jgi:hypothetical protein
MSAQAAVTRQANRTSPIKLSERVPTQQEYGPGGGGTDPWLRLVGACPGTAGEMLPAGHLSGSGSRPTAPGRHRVAQSPEAAASGLPAR